jgi:tetratricopeptide (TPR) repeat protein
MLRPSPKKSWGRISTTTRLCSMWRMDCIMPVNSDGLCNSGEGSKKSAQLSLDFYLNMGACYEDLGETQQAIKNYKRELELSPVSGTALYNLGALYFRSHKYKLAANYLERSYSQKNSVEACVPRLAHSYFKTRQSEKEQILYEEYLQTNPNNTWALNNLGSHLMGQGQYNRALLRLKKAARIDPADKLVAKNIQKAERARQKLKSSTTN